MCVFVASVVVVGLVVVVVVGVVVVVDDVVWYWLLCLSLACFVCALVGSSM